MKEKKKKVFLPLLGLFVFGILALALFAGGASAGAVTFNLPASNALINGTLVKGNCTINVTQAEAEAGAQNNLSVYIGTVTVALNLTNSTEGLQTAVFWINTSLVGDSASTTLTAKLMNISNGAALGTGTRSVRLSNDDPLTPVVTGLLPQTHVRGTMDYNVVASSAGGAVITYSTVLTDPEGTHVTKTGTNPIFSGDEIPVMGEYSVTTTATDELSRTSTKTDTFTVNSNTAGGAVVVNQVNTQAASAKNSQNSALLIAVIVVVVGYFVMKNGKKNGGLRL